jgi:hypothetical protein
MLTVVLQSVIVLAVIILIIAIVTVVMLSVIMLFDVMLCVVAHLVILVLKFCELVSSVLGTFDRHKIYLCNAFCNAYV